MATFTKNTVSLNDGNTYPAKYQAEGETVIISITMPNNQIAKVTLPKDHEFYVAALSAAQEAAEGKKTRGPVPEKTFIGLKIDGPEWRIEFGSERTRIIFKRVPCKAYREAVKAAGFYWSPNDKSWNKKATWKSYRAAQALHDRLWKIREGKETVSA